MSSTSIHELHMQNFECQQQSNAFSIFAIDPLLFTSNVLVVLHVPTVCPLKFTLCVQVGCASCANCLPFEIYSLCSGWCGEVRDVIYTDSGKVTLIYRVTVRGTDGFCWVLLFGATVLTGIVLIRGTIPYVSETFARILFLSNSLTFMMVRHYQCL
jgi:hypothetical protein